MDSILSRRSFKVLDNRAIDDEALETIVEEGLYAPAGMNRQPRHVTVIRSREALGRFGAARRALPLPPGIPAEVAAAMGDPVRNAPVMDVASVKQGGASARDCRLAMENMLIAAASPGIMGGWDRATVADLFPLDPGLAPGLIPEGNVAYATAFFGYPGPGVEDRGERRGTVSYP